MKCIPVLNHHLLHKFHTNSNFIKEKKRILHKWYTADECWFLFCQLPSTDSHFLDAMWGKLASEILMQNWETALDDLQKLKDIIDSNVSPVNQLQSYVGSFPFL